MALYGGASMQADLVRGITAEIKQLTVDRLKRVLRQEHLQVSGIKNELQIRLIAHLENAARHNEQETIGRIRNLIRGHQTYNMGNSNPYPSPYSNHTPNSSASPQFANSPTPRLPPPSSSFAMQTPNFPQNRLTFKNSPFYTIQRPLSTVTELRAREHTRDTARITVTLDHVLATQIQADPTLKVMVFCAAETFDPAWKAVDITFPHHAELKCNQEEVKSNLKGMKNKPGTTRPADVTSFLRKKAGFPNSIELVYALTTKAKSIQQKFFLVVNLVQTRPVHSLVAELKRGKYISKDRVIREMLARAKDDDIVATASVMSLKDPVQMTRIETPCRSISCRHNECFDAAVFLALQEQAPQWTCPICNRPAGWENLIFDQFVEGILHASPDDTEQVTIEPDGQWHLNSATSQSNLDTPNARRNKNDYDDDDDDDDDDLVVVEDPFRPPSSVATIRSDPRTPSFVRTPPLLGGDSSFTTAPSASSSTQRSNKRPRQDVIDLTLSDDDDDQPPVSRIKRPSLSSQVSDGNRQRGLDHLSFQIPPPRPPIPPSRNFYDAYNSGI